MTRQEKVDYVKNWKRENEIFLCDALGLEDGPQYQFLTGTFISLSTSKNQIPFLQEVLQAVAVHMSFGKYALYSVKGNNANGTMSALGFALLFGNEDKESWMHFWNFIKKTHPIVNHSNFTIVTNQDKGTLAAIEDSVSLPLVGRFLCSFNCKQNIVKKCDGQKGHKALSALWVNNLLIGCKSVASLSATRKKYEGKMFPTDHHYLFNIVEEMQFPAARCAQSDSVCMYGNTASSGIEAMNRAYEDICQRTAVDILYAALILLKKESTRYDKACNLAWNHAQILTPKGMELMEEVFKNVNVQDFKFHFAENDDHHTAIVSKKSTSEREYTMIIPRLIQWGQDVESSHVDIQRRKGSPVTTWWQFLSWGEPMDLQGPLSYLIGTQQYSGAINFLRILISTHTKYSNR
jgi:hypothetical protein